MAEKIASLMATLGKEQKASNHCHSKHIEKDCYKFKSG